MPLALPFRPNENHRGHAPQGNPLKTIPHPLLPFGEGLGVGCFSKYLTQLTLGEVRPGAPGPLKVGPRGQE